jgi:copper chaperone
MKQKFHIDGIGCGTCVANIKKVLEAHPIIDKIQFFLKPKGTTIISMKEKLSLDDLQKQLDKLEGYTITEFHEVKSTNI